MKGSYLTIFVTIPENFNYEELVTALVREGLAACVNVVPVEKSIFKWKGRIESEAEKLLIIKSKLEVFDKLVKRIKELHPYTVPEIIGVPIIVGNREYLEWLEEVVG